MTEENHTPEEENQNEENRKSQIKWTSGLIAVIVILIFVLIAFVVKNLSFVPLKKKTTKGEFRAQYSIDKKTFKPRSLDKRILSLRNVSKCIGQQPWPTSLYRLARAKSGEIPDLGQLKIVLQLLLAPDL